MMGNYKNNKDNNLAAAAAHTLLMADTVIGIESLICGEIWGSYGSDVKHYCHLGFLWESLETLLSSGVLMGVT